MNAFLWGRLLVACLLVLAVSLRSRIRSIPVHLQHCNKDLSPPAAPEALSIQQYSAIRSPNLLRRNCISDVVRIGSTIVSHLIKLWNVKFFLLCDVIFLVKLQGKFELDQSWKWKPDTITNTHPNGHVYDSRGELPDQTYKTLFWKSFLVPRNELVGFRSGGERLLEEQVDDLRRKPRDADETTGKGGKDGEGHHATHQGG